jgi:hypothetical protein
MVLQRLRAMVDAALTQLTRFQKASRLPADLNKPRIGGQGCRPESTHVSLTRTHNSVI